MKKNKSFIDNYSVQINWGFNNAVEGTDTIASMTEKILVDRKKKFEHLMADEIRDIAKENGFTEVWLFDDDKVIEMIKYYLNKGKHRRDKTQ